VLTVVAARATSHPSVVVDCPVCDRPLPRVVVDVDARADVEVVEGARSGRVLLLTVQAQTLDPAWWAAAREEHPDCIPPELGAASITLGPGRYVEHGGRVHPL
jgi:hypothetical protein